jgi:MinD-like ATPase involved in chromosome partitioning or flagellar assembly
MSHAAACVVAIASGKGGVGKSFLALNLAWALAELGQRVSLVELDADAGALSIAAGLGEPKLSAPASDPHVLATRALTIPGNARVQLLRAADIAPVLARSPNAFDAVLNLLPAHWRIVDLAPGIGAQNILWMRRARMQLLIGTPELVSVQAMLRMHRQLQRQLAYERLCASEPRLRDTPSLVRCRERLIQMLGATAAKELWTAAFDGFQLPRWIFNRVLPDDDAQLTRITRYLKTHAGDEASRPRSIPEDIAQLRCGRIGRPLLAAEPTSPAAGAIRGIAADLLGGSERAGPFRNVCKTNPP